MRERLIHVFIGTKAQYVKTAPLLRLMDRKGVPYRLVDSGQHAQLSRGMREDLQVRRPDHVLGGDRDITSIPQALGWGFRLGGRLWSGARLRESVFGGRGGICVVHGDTPSTLLSTLMARRAGLQVAHMEAGLRSGKLTHPFPEELIRIMVMRVSDILFAPSADAARNLDRMRVKGRVVRLAGNTSLEAVRFALERSPPEPSGPAIATMHRVENLHRRARAEAFVRLVRSIAAHRPLRFVMHEPTEAVIRRMGALKGLEDSGVQMIPLAQHHRFVAMLHAAPFVITDGGSIQEECALLGVPTLLWRDRTERLDGVGQNVVVSRYDPRTTEDFLNGFERHRRPMAQLTENPSEQILDTVVTELGVR